MGKLFTNREFSISAVSWNSDFVAPGQSAVTLTLVSFNSLAIASLKGTWYLANTQLQLGMTQEAIESMERVIELDGSFSRVAKNKLESIRQQQPAS